MSDGMKKLLLGVLTIVALSAGVAIAVGAAGDDGVPAAATTTSTGTTTTGTTTTGTTTGDEISGPCDEAEHADDPRCTGAGADDDRRGRDDGALDDDGPGDISGPCDEAEHANDPRCTGAGRSDSRVDNSGPGSANSGRGSSDDDGLDDDHGWDDDDDDGHRHGHGGDDHEDD